MVTRFIENAWASYKKNYLPIMGAQIIYILIVFAILILSLVPLIAAGVNVGRWIMQETPLIPPNAIAQLTAPLMMFFAGIFIMAIIATALGTGRIGIYADALRKKPVKVETMFSVAKEKFWTSVGSTIFVAVIILAIFTVLIILTAMLYLASPIISSIALLIDILLVILVSVLFMLTKQAIVIDNLCAVDAVKKSYALIKKNYLEFLSVVLIFAIITIAFAIIPIVGRIIIILVVQPVTELAYTAFYMELTGTAGKEKVKEKTETKAGAIAKEPTTAAEKKKAHRTKKKKKAKK